MLVKYNTYFFIFVGFLSLLAVTSFASIPENKDTDLASIAFDNSLTVKTRWRALMSLAVSQEERSLVYLENAVKSKDWFMRDAGLMAMGQIAPKRALYWARRLIHDPALVVRTTAVLVFKDRGQINDIDLLWRELNNKINFKKGQSLWIRHHIVTALAHLSSPGDVPKFIPLLDDSDHRVRNASITALETLTGQKPQYQSQDMTQKVAHWKNYEQL